MQKRAADNTKPDQTANNDTTQGAPETMVQKD